jgi:16S rRNA (uracil1498-N3)-methyltransferase
MNRFFVPREDCAGPVIRLTDQDDVRHLTRVLRLRPGEEVLVSDGEGGGFLAVLEGYDKHSARLKVVKPMARRQREDQRWRLSLAVAVPKNARFEDMVDKTTQLGVDEIIPLVTERTLVTAAQAKKKMGRYQRVIKAAAKQSGALFLPCLCEPMTFDQLLGIAAGYDIRCLPNLSEATLFLPQALAGIRKGRILVCIGPEGDFSSVEIRAAFAAGFKGLCLGDSVLRVDTAAIAVAAFLRLYGMQGEGA